jgi:hypothetical protein
LLVFLLLVGYVQALSARHATRGSGITKANFDLIVQGMTQEDVEHILGERGKGWISSGKMQGKAWITEEALIEVFFSRANGMVVTKHFSPLPKRSIFQRIITWLSAGHLFLVP